MPLRILLVALVIGTMVSCSTADRVPAGKPLTKAYVNPVYAPGTAVADPGAIRAQDGWFYLYATQGHNYGHKLENIQCARSKDLVSWERLPDCMPEKPKWARKKQNFWAPDVQYFNGRYVMYVSAEQNKNGFCIAAGTSAQPQGPFTNFERLVCGPSFANIDPMGFEDPLTKRKFLYWGSASQPIRVQELSADGLSFAPGSQAREVLPAIREPRGALKASDGYTYFFGTQIGHQEKPDNIQAVRTKDFITLEKLPDAMPVRPKWAHGKADHYTPQAVQLSDGVYGIYIAIATKHDESCISLGTSTQPGGPYSNFVKLDCSKKYKLLNPSVAVDPSTQRKFMYWENWENLQASYRELSSDGRSFLPGSKLQKTFTPPSIFQFDHVGWDNLIEGAWVTFKNGYYYLYYSGSECCSQRAHYAVSVARSGSPFGPFTRLSESRNSANSVVLKGNQTWFGSGHNAVIADDKGQEWILYHAIPRAKPRVLFNKKDTEPNRIILIDRIKYSPDGWPQIHDGTPSVAPQEAPAVK
jgi:arabinan endo-1,5-alpha-L-arabinosidase